MKTIVSVDSAAYWYPDRIKPAVEGISLEIAQGEFTILYGSSGSGKSTLCRMLNGLVPKYSGGRMMGKVTVDGLDTKYNSINILSSIVGMVFQDPESQLVMDKVENEIAFGLENKGLDESEIAERVKWVSEKISVDHLLDRKNSELSGGEKQRVVLASVLAMKPKVLVLDEPTSQLDMEARTEFISLVSKLNKEDGLTVVMVEHSIEDVIGYADYVFDLDAKKKMLPAEFRERLRKQSPARKQRNIPPNKIIEVKNVSKNLSGRKVLKNVTLDVLEGECLAIVGRNGAGKTTLVKHFNGLLKPDEGKVIVLGADTSNTPVEELAKHVSYLPQNPSDMLFSETVREEIEFTLKHMNASADVDEIISKFNLTEHINEYPRDLSVGEKQRLAIAAVLVSNPKVVVLDEPTRGIDSSARELLASTVEAMLSEGKTLVLVTQDADLANRLADRTVRLEGGVIAE
ncbi:MAG: ATP-binding cassette domain-containing protein [Candidatus Altiarchaeota archaeon]|nr:ATP-binding cassette domain-containing protein [Candidatus Altiarchaeota archaeon]